MDIASIKFSHDRSYRASASVDVGVRKREPKGERLC